MLTSVLEAEVRSLPLTLGDRQPQTGPSSSDLQIDSQGLATRSTVATDTRCPFRDSLPRRATRIKKTQPWSGVARSRLQRALHRLLTASPSSLGAAGCS